MKFFCFFGLHSYFLAGRYIKYVRGGRQVCFAEYYHCECCENYKRILIKNEI